MADKRAFAKFDVGYLDNPKMMDVLDASSIALCMHVASVLYCAQHLTDGVVSPRTMQRKAGGSAEDTQVLVEAGLWHQPGHDCSACPQPPENRVFVHDFLEHNRSAESAKRVSERGRKAADARWQGDATSNASGNATSNAERERKRERKKEVPSDSGESQEPPRSDVQAVIDFMSEALRSNDVKFKVGKAWFDAARLLIDKDGYTVDQIHYVIRHASTDTFWAPNILSLPKLREKFETLKMQAVEKGKGRAPTSTVDRVSRTAEMGARLQQQSENQDQLQIGD